MSASLPNPANDSTAASSPADVRRADVRTVQPGEVRLLPADGGVSSSHPINGGGGTIPAAGVTPAVAPPRQLSELPKDELSHLAEEYGLDPTRYPSRQAIVAAIHARRQLIASMDREAMLDVIRWSRRPVTFNAAPEQIAQEIARIRTMNFRGLSQRGLLVLARLRGVSANDDEPVPALVKKLKKQEGLFSKLNRKRRAVLGSLVGKIVGEDFGPADYQFLPGGTDSNGDGGAGVAVGSSGRSPSIKEEIEESGLLGGITSRIKKSADQYVNQKLDEIEARIDRKLDEIDRRLAEWRDKEIANRIRILKITLWASVIVGALSLVYTYVKVYFFPDAPRHGAAPTAVTQSAPAQQQAPHRPPASQPGG